MKQSVEFPDTGCFVCINSCPPPPYASKPELTEVPGSVISVQLPTGEDFVLDIGDDRQGKLPCTDVSKFTKHERKVFLIALIDSMYEVLIMARNYELNFKYDHQIRKLNSLFHKNH